MAYDPLWQDCEQPWALSPRTLTHRYLLACLLIGGLSLFTGLTGDLVNEDNDVLLYLSLVTLSALYLGRGPAKLSAALSLLALHQGHFHPGYSLKHIGIQYVFSVAIFWTIASRVGELSQWQRREKWLAQVREQEAKLVADFSQELSAADSEAEIEGLLGRGGDISEEVKKQLLAMVREHRQRLQNREAARQKSIQLAAESVQTSLLHSISHDIQTPLATILGTVEMLKDSQVTLEAGERDQLLQLASEQAERIRMLARNLINSSKMESGYLSLDCRNLEVGELFSEASKSFAPAQRQRLRLLAPTGLRLWGDFVLMTQVLTNLLDNALKYSAADQPVEVDCLGEGCLVVRDRAPTIEAGERQRVFERFYRLATGKKAVGSGLGLSICQGILRSHGGEIRVEPRSDGGNCFIFQLPEEPHGQSHSTG
ncbi:MAG: ATP-binding protein [Vulcanimicrobiota bacterium]